MKGVSLKWRWLLIRRIDKLWPLFLLLIIFWPIWRMGEFTKASEVRKVSIYLPGC